MARHRSASTTSSSTSPHRRRTGLSQGACPITTPQGPSGECKDPSVPSDLPIQSFRATAKARNIPASLVECARDPARRAATSGPSQVENETQSCKDGLMTRQSEPEKSEANSIQTRSFEQWKIVRVSPATKLTDKFSSSRPFPVNSKETTTQKEIPHHTNREASMSMLCECGSYQSTKSIVPKDITMTYQS